MEFCKGLLKLEDCSSISKNLSKPPAQNIDCLWLFSAVILNKTIAFSEKLDGPSLQVIYACRLKDLKWKLGIKEHESILT